MVAQLVEMMAELWAGWKAELKAVQLVALLAELLAATMVDL